MEEQNIKDNFKKRITHVNVDITVNDKSSELLDFMLELSNERGEKPATIIEYIFTLGLQYIRGTFEGVAIAHNDEGGDVIKIDDIYNAVIEMQKRKNKGE